MVTALGVWSRTVMSAFRPVPSGMLPTPDVAGTPGERGVLTRPGHWRLPQASQGYLPGVKLCASHQLLIHDNMVAALRRRLGAGVLMSDPWWVVPSSSRVIPVFLITSRRLHLSAESAKKTAKKTANRTANRRIFEFFYNFIEYSSVRVIAAGVA